MKKTQAKKRDDKKIASEIWKNAGEWFDYYSDNIANHRKDFDFCYAEDGQWTAAEIDEAEKLKKYGKTKMTFNMMPKIINTLVGEYAESDPQLKVRNTDTVDIDQQLTKKINVMTGLLRNISIKSRFDEVKKAAFKSAIGGGFGAYAIVVEKEKRLSFNLVPRYKVINDPTTCFWDRTSQEIDKSDGWFTGRCYIWKKEAVKRKYPNVEIPTGNEECLAGFDSFSWLTDDDVIIADYYKKIPIKRHIALLSNDKVLDFEDAEEMVRKSKTGIINEPLKILKDEVIDDFKMHFYRAVGESIVEDREWQGENLPIIFQGGIVIKYRGREYTFSLIRWLKEAQRAFNHARNETWFRIKKMRNEPYLVSDKNVEGHEDEWKKAHLPRSALRFKESPSGFVPRREPPPEIPQALAIETQQSFNDIQQILGRFEANQGAPSNEKSGLAILRRQTAGNLSVKPFFDNAESALQSGATAILDLATKVIDNDRLVQITDENGNSSNVRINNDQSMDLTEGEFEVIVSVGPNFETQKADAIGLLLESYKANPELTKISADIFARNLDMKDSALFADRVKTYLQPQITADEAQNLSQEQIIARNQKQETEGQKMKDQLIMQNLQLEQMVKRSKMQDDRMKAMSSRLSSLADMVNAQTNRQKAADDKVIANVKASAEITKSQDTVLTERLKLAHEVGKTAQSSQRQLFG